MSGILLLFVLMFLTLGPKRTSELARKLGQLIGEFKRAARDFQSRLENDLPKNTLDDRLPLTDSHICLSPTNVTVPGRRVEEICKSHLPVESPVKAPAEEGAQPVLGEETQNIAPITVSASNQSNQDSSHSIST